MARLISKRRGKEGWSNPKDHYIYSIKSITVLELSKIWGIRFFTLENQARKQHWVERRRKYQDEVENRARERIMEIDVERRTKMIEDANDTHMRLGRRMYSTGNAALGLVIDPLIKNGSLGDFISPEKVMTSAPKLISGGVDLERKGLGLADKIVNVQHTKMFAVAVLNIVEKYVTDPIIFRNIVLDLRQIGKDEEEELKAHMTTLLPEGEAK